MARRPLRPHTRASLDHPAGQSNRIDPIHGRFQSSREHRPFSQEQPTRPRIAQTGERRGRGRNEPRMMMRAGRLVPTHQLTTTTTDARVDPRPHPTKPQELRASQSGPCCPPTLRLSSEEGKERVPLQPWYVQSERPPPYATVALAPPAHTPFTNTNPSRQPLRLEVKKKLTARSDRIKSVDLHPVEVSGATEAGWYTCVCEQRGALGRRRAHWSIDWSLTKDRLRGVVTHVLD